MDGTDHVAICAHVRNVQRAGTEALGADIVTVGPASSERKAKAECLARERGLSIVPPYNDENIIAGAASVGMEILEDFPEVEVILVPVGGGGLASTAEDYGRFMRMLLNGGQLDGARVLKAETVALMGQNQIGAVSVPALKSALPRSADFTFIDDNKDKWGLGFLITVNQVPGKRSPGSLSWGGINNTFFWIDPARGIGGVIMMQYLPFADAKALATYDAFERGTYQLVAEK